MLWKLVPDYVARCDAKWAFWIYKKVEFLALRISQVLSYFFESLMCASCSTRHLQLEKCIRNSKFVHILVKPILTVAPKIYGGNEKSWRNSERCVLKAEAFSRCREEREGIAWSWAEVDEGIVKVWIWPACVPTLIRFMRFGISGGNST